jgi:glycosyltransferase involved in cell wall biosynthesis
MTKMNHENPKVSVVITCFNREKYIAEAIESALMQTYPNIEIIISDNNSTDKSICIIKKYEKDDRVIINQNSINIGVIENFKKAAIELSSGEFITFISSDDYLCDENFIKKAIDIFDNDNQIVVIRGRNIFKNELNGGKFFDCLAHQYWGREYYCEKSIPGTKVFLDYPDAPSIGFGGSIYKRDLFIKLKFGSNKKIYYHDAEISLKILLNGSAAFIEDKTYVVRIHDENDTGVLSLERIINNTEFIESVYIYAKINSTLKLYELNDWRHRMLLQYFKVYLKAMDDSNLNDDFNIWIANKYSEINSEIKKSLNWKLFKLSRKNKFLKYLYPKIAYFKNAVSGYIKN